MPFSRVAEQRIREALAEGRFDNLPGAGQPIDLEEYFKTPAELRLAYSVLKSANCVPEAVQLMNEVSHLERAVEETTDPAARQSLRQALGHRQTQLAIARERARRTARSE